MLCLVRASDKEAARRRIFDTLKKLGQLDRLLAAYADKVEGTGTGGGGGAGEGCPMEVRYRKDDFV